MAEIITSIEPGYYATGQKLTVKFPAGARRAIVTRTNKPPVLSEILAYDTGPIPPGTTPVERPFLAVTQDGRGNVVYDGGAPKFQNKVLYYNSGDAWPPTNPTTWDGLPPSWKYTYNAFAFIADKRKVAAGNRKILIVGNMTLEDDYDVKGSNYNPTPGQKPGNASEGFKDCFEAVAAAGNWTLTYLNLSDINPMNVSAIELDKYVAVVFVSMKDLPVGASNIAPAFSNALAYYRSTGSGIFIITDHGGGNYTSIEDALARSSVFLGDANRVAANFGCYFSGNVNRSPVLVSEIKRQIGLPGPPESHPLLNNLADDSYIYATLSESIVYPQLYTNEEVSVTEDLVVEMYAVGRYWVNVLVQMEDGTILTRPMMFNIVNNDSVFMYDNLSRECPATTNTYKKVFDYTVVYKDNPELTLGAEIIVDGFFQGYCRIGFSSGGNIFEYYPLSGLNTPIPARNGVPVGFNIYQPFEYKITTTLNIPDGAGVFALSGQVSTFLKALRTVPSLMSLTPKAAYDDVIRTGRYNYISPKQRNLNVSFNWFEEMRRARAPFSTDSLAECTLPIHATPAAWLTAKPTAKTTMGSAVLVASTNEVHYYCERCLDWLTHPQKADALFGLNRLVNANNTGVYWKINANNTTKV